MLLCLNSPVRPGNDIGFRLWGVELESGQLMLMMLAGAGC